MTMATNLLTSVIVNTTYVSIWIGLRQAQARSPLARPYRAACTGPHATHSSCMHTMLTCAEHDSGCVAVAQ